MPVMAIEDVVLQEKSSNLSEFADFTGDNFFKSVYDLENERKKEVDRAQENFNKTFFYSPSPTNDYAKRRAMPPIKKLRLTVSRWAKDKAAAKKQKLETEEVQVDANGIVIQNSEEEKEVLEEEQSETSAMVRCKTLKYLPESNEMEGIGGVTVLFPQQNTTLTGQRMLYNTESGIIQLFDDVVVNRQGSKVYGDYLKVDLNEESGLLTNIKASEMSVSIEAESGYMFGDKIIAENGKLTSDYDNLIYLRSSGFGEDMKNFVIPEDEMYFLLNDADSNKYFMKVNAIKISAKGSHDKIQLKQPKIYSIKTGKKIFALPSMTLYTNKEHDYFEGNYPELGSYSAFGMYAGPGIVLETPFGSTLKLMPTVNYKNKFGFGGIGRFQSGTNKTEFGYNTAANMFLLKGQQRLDDKLFLQYGMNSYINNWFMGNSWLGYGGEAIYEDGYKMNSFLYDNASLSFRHRISAGIFRENDRNRSNKKYNGYHRMGTFRLKYMAEVNQVLYSFIPESDYDTKNGWRQATLSLVGQGSAAVYGTGDTQIVGRIGPRLSTQYKNWRQDIGYYLSGSSDNTPMVSFDSFRYGKSNVYVREYWRVCKLLTLGLYGSYNLSDSSYYDYVSNRRSQLREATVYASIGPDDFKLNLGYDFLRENTYFGVSMAMNTKGASVDYKRLEIKNADELGKAQNEMTQTLQTPKFVPPPSPYKSKASVTDVEDITTYMNGELL